MIRVRKTASILFMVTFIFSITTSGTEQTIFKDVIFHNHGVVMLIIHPETGKIVEANEAAATYYGHSIDTLKSMTIQQINTLTPSQVEQERLRASEEQRNYFIFPHRLASGEIRTVEVYSWPLDLDGESLLLSIVHDISSRVEALETVLEQERTLSSFFRAAPVTMAIAVDRVIVQINEAIEAMTRYSPEELVGRNTRVLYASDEEYERVGKALYPSPDTKMPWMVETQWVTKENRIIDVLLTSSYLDLQDPSLGVTVIGMDITQEKQRAAALENYRRIFFIILTLGLLAQLSIIVLLVRSNIKTKRMKEELRVAKEAADEASNAKSQFLSKMSHEMRTPLNGIMGFTEVLSESDLDQNQHEYLGYIAKSADNLLGLVNDVLDFSKIQSGRMKVHLKPSSIAEICQNATKPVGLLAEQKGLKIFTEISSKIPQWVETDPDLLRQVLLNLLSNAIKFTDEGSVSLSVSVLEHTINDQEVKLLFSVEDTGIGISKENQKHLFQDFYQVDSSTTKKRDGTGLGLAISQNLLNQMGSQLEVESQLGEGSRFSFQLVVKAVGHPISAPSETPSENNDDEVFTRWEKADYRILIAEDNPINMKLIKTILSGFFPKATIEGVETGIDAVKRWRTLHPDLIVMDLLMPEMDGLDATRMIRQEETSSRVPIIALTAATEGKDVNECFSAGMDAFLSKPIIIDELVAELKRWLE